MRLVVTCARFARLTKACGAWLSLDALRANPANPRTIHSERTWNPLPTSPRTFARNHLPRAELHRTRNPPPKPAPKPTLNSTWNLPEPVRDTPCPARNRFRNSLDPSELERFQTQTGRNLFWYPPSTPLPRLPEPRTCPDPPGTCARTCPGTCPRPCPNRPQSSRCWRIARDNRFGCVQKIAGISASHFRFNIWEAAISALPPMHCPHVNPLLFHKG